MLRGIDPQSEPAGADSRLNCQHFYCPDEYI